MDEFLVPSVSGSGGLLFFDRAPLDPAQIIHGFWVRITDHHLSAIGQVDAGNDEYGPFHPAGLFARMSERWSGWPGALTWSSLEGELSLSCTQDPLGHVAIRVELRSGPMADDWRAQATIMTEAGQLEALSRRAALFFGRAA